MLEQQDSKYSGESGGVSATVFPLVINGGEPGIDDTRDGSGSRSESVDLVDKNEGDESGAEKERSESRESNVSVKSRIGHDGGDSGEGDDDITTAATTVRIHTTYKKRASKFMNRPNVQNGLGAHSLLNPYANGGTGSAGLGGSVGGRLFGVGSSSNSNPGHNFSTVSSRSRHYHRSFARNEGGGSNSSGGGATSPNNNGQSSTTASSSTATTVESRPPFVTTVTRGRFLPSKFDLMVEKSLFTFSSRPKPVGLITKHHCSLSGPLRESNSQNSQPRGAHDYFNVMWDPHVYRGTTTTLTSSLKQPDSTDLSSSKEERHRKKRTYLHGSQNTLNNGNSTTFNSIGGGTSTTTIRSNRYKMTTKVTSRSRTFPPPEGRHQVHVQTEEYLEDLSRDAVRGPEVDAFVQTDPIEDEELLSSPLVNTTTTLGRDYGKGLPVATGVDASTQVLPGELITFDERVQPVVEAVVGKILEQALLETMEEEEIGALKAQQNRFLEKRKEEERELKRLQEQQERISAEKERLKRHLEMQFKQRQGQQSNGEVISSGESCTALLTESGAIPADGNGNSGALSTAYLLELLPSVIQSLREEGLLLEDQDGDDSLSSALTAAGLRCDESKDEGTDENDDLQMEKREQQLSGTTAVDQYETSGEVYDDNRAITEVSYDDNEQTTNEVHENRDVDYVTTSPSLQGENLTAAREPAEEAVEPEKANESIETTTEIIAEEGTEGVPTPVADENGLEAISESASGELAGHNAESSTAEECLESSVLENIPNGDISSLMQE